MQTMEHAHIYIGEQDSNKDGTAMRNRFIMQ